MTYPISPRVETCTRKEFRKSGFGYFHIHKMTLASCKASLPVPLYLYDWLRTSHVCLWRCIISALLGSIVLLRVVLLFQALVSVLDHCCTRGISGLWQYSDILSFSGIMTSHIATPCHHWYHALCCSFIKLIKVGEFCLCPKCFTELGRGENLFMSYL